MSEEDQDTIERWLSTCPEKAVPQELFVNELDRMGGRAAALEETDGELAELIVGMSLIEADGEGDHPGDDDISRE